MKHYIFLPIALAVVTATLLFSSCTISLNKDTIEAGEMTKETRNLGAFNQIHVGGAMDIEFVTSDSSYIEIETGKNLLPRIKTEVNDSILRIMPNHEDGKPSYSSSERTFHFQTNDGITGDKKINIKVFSPSLKEINIAGASSFKADNITSDNIIIMLSGATAADIKNLTCKNVRIDATGASKIILKENGADNTQVSAAGACKADITFNNCNRTGINVAGAASMKLKGTLNTLDKHIAGACSLDTNELKLTNNNNQ
jgi:hypothetical protein